MSSEDQPNASASDEPASDKSREKTFPAETEKRKMETEKTNLDIRVIKFPTKKTLQKKSKYRLKKL